MELFAYVIMTNHVYCILRSKEEKLSGLIRDFKKHTSKKVLFEVAHNQQESRKEWLELIFSCHAKYNKRVGGDNYGPMRIMPLNYRVMR